MGVYRDKSVTEETALDVMKALKYEFAQYGLSVKLSWMRPYDRQSFQFTSIIMEVAQKPLESDCDKILMLVGRNARDYLWGALMLPEVFGAVETATRTRGYVVVQTGSLQQILMGATPESNAIHEFYHLVGCDDFQSGSGCYDRIMYLRKEAQRNRKAGNDFFPTIGQKIDILMTDRARVEHRIQSAIEYEKRHAGEGL